MLTALTRAVSTSLANCELTFLARETIDLTKARAQHRAYESALRQLGAKLISLPEQPDLPDSMFVEDPAIVLDELAVILLPGAESRHAERVTLAAALSPFRKLEFIRPMGTIEGGDLLRIGKRIFAGLSKRTNEEGIRQLGEILAPFGYSVICVPVTGCLHLKSAVTNLGNNTLLANRAWFDAATLPGFEWVDVDYTEPHAANALELNGAVVFPASFPRTLARIQKRGFRVTTLDISELQKAESGLTCSSLIFEA